MPFNDTIRQRVVRPIASTLTSNRIMLYAFFSTGAMLAAIANACRKQSNFYSITVYLSRSGRSLLILANFGFLAALVAGKVMQRLFFGPLQPREVERLYDQTWMFVTESLLAFTIFRDEFDIPFVLMFGFLLFVKCFHWLMSDRVESMDQVTYPGPPMLFHIRANALFLTMSVIDLSMFLFAVESTLTNGVGGMVLFATEYAILMASAMNAMARYMLNNIDYRRASSRGGENAPSWDNKSMYVFYIELLTDFLKLTTYLTFFMIILAYYGLPLNIIRDVYLTARSFITRLRALIRYRNATRDMDRRYPNATEEELTAMSDRTCIICREELALAAADQQPGQQDGPNMSPKKLPCGHIFHFQCLRSWLERQQSCPTWYEISILDVGLILILLYQSRRTVLETAQPNRNGAQPQQQGNPFRQGMPAAAAAPNQGQPPAGGVGGIFGRLIGMAPQPQLVPGGVPHGFMPPPPGAPQPPPVQGQPQIPGYVTFIQQPPAHPYPPGYPYHYPYYPPPMYPQLPPNAQVLRGFYGPGGVYYPWPPEQDAQGAQGAGARETPEQNGAAGGARNAIPTPQVNETPAPTTPGEPTPPTHNAPPPPSLQSSNGSSAESNEQGNPNSAGSTANPREAAALAALRRLNSLPGVSPRINGITNRPTAPPPPTAATSTSSTVDTSATPAEPQPPRPTPTAPAVPDVTPTSNDPRLDAPTLIPLYEFNPQANPLRFPNVGPSQLRSQTYRPQGSSTRPSASATANAHGGNGGLPRTTQYRRTPLHQLPATLTEEQLTRLDGVTREAIDERLRVLDNVQGAIFRCVEELTRIRSVLPAPTLAQSGTAEGSGSSGGVNPPSAGAASSSTSEAPVSGSQTQTSDVLGKDSSTGTASRSRLTFVPNTQEGSSSSAPAEGPMPDPTSTEGSIPETPLPTPAAES